MKDQNSFSSKNKDQKQNPFSIYKVNKRNLKRRLSDKKINKKTLASSSTSYPNKNKSSTFSNIKPVYSYKETIAKAYNKLNTVLHSYNMTKESINIKITNDIIFDERKRIVSVFKDYLLWNETSDFLKQYYKKNKSIKMILKFITYYETYIKFYPEYGPHEDILKILKKNLKKKRKYYERIEEDDVNNYLNDKKDINQPKFERLIKDSEIKLSSVNSKELQKNNLKNSKSTLMLDSIDKDNKRNNINKSIDNNNKDFYSILTAFIDSDDKIYEKKDIYNSNYINNYNNLFIFDPKLSKYFQKSFDEEKNKEKKTDRHIIIGINSKHKNKNMNYMNLLNNMMYQKIRPKSKDEKITKFKEKKKEQYKEIRLNKKSNNNILMKAIRKYSKVNNEKDINKSNSISAYRKQYSFKYNEKTHTAKIKPQNFKRLFNSYNRYEKRENNYSGNFYNLFPHRNTEGNESYRRSPKSLLNTSPIYLIKKNKLIINTLKNKNNHIIKYERLKKANDMNPMYYTDHRNNISETESNKNSYYNKNPNNLQLKLKYTKNKLNKRKEIHIPKKNTITRISPVKQIKDNNPKKKYKNIINKIKSSENPFTIDNSSRINNSANRKNMMTLKQKSKKYFNKITTKNKEEIKHINKINNKHKNNLILVKSNLNPSAKKTCSLNKNNKLTNQNSLNSLSLKIKNKSVSQTRKNKNSINRYNKEGSKKVNNYIKHNNILKSTINKSNSKKELNKKMKTNNNIILKSCCSNINDSANKNIFIFENFEEPENNKKDTIKQLSLLNFSENSLLKNIIKNKYETSNNNGSKKARICLRLPMTSNINKI